MAVPETRYANSGDVRIAYQVIGHGSLDLVFVPGFMSNLDVQWEDPGFAHLLNRLGVFTRLILLDKRGTGLSDRVDNHHLPTLETRIDDVRAVMDAVGSNRAALLGASEGGPMSILFAATYPQRVRALVLYGSYAHFHTWVMGREALEEFIGGIEKSWGTGASAVRFAPDRAKDARFTAWWARYERLSLSPSAAVALARMNAAIDVRSVLASVRVPTLVVHRRDDARIKFLGGNICPIKSLARALPSLLAAIIPSGPATLTPRSMRSRNSSPGRGRRRCPTACWRPSSWRGWCRRRSSPRGSATGSGMSCSNAYVTPRAMLSRAMAANPALPG